VEQVFHKRIIWRDLKMLVILHRQTLCSLITSGNYKRAWNLFMKRIYSESYKHQRLYWMSTIQNRALL
jgi:hypothetical protein